MFGARNNVNSRSVASCPAMKCPIIFENPCSPSPASTGSPFSLLNERWMWQLLPSRSLNFAMKVSDWPCWSAISLAPFL